MIRKKEARSGEEGQEGGGEYLLHQEQREGAEIQGFATLNTRRGEERTSGRQEGRQEGLPHLLGERANKERGGHLVGWVVGAMVRVAPLLWS